MAAPQTTRRAINASGDSLTLFTGGMSRIGFGVTGTWAGTLTFFGSNDGVNFFKVGVLPFPVTAPLTQQNNTTANGNFEAFVNNLVAFKIGATTLTSGTALIQMAASNDTSYQDAFMASTSRAVSQSQSGGTANTLTIAAQANRAWRCRTLSVGWSVAPAAAVELTISDGGSATLWDGYIPPTPATGGLIGTYLVPLPSDPGIPGITGGGVVGTVGNSLVITLSAPGGSVVSKLNAEMIPE